MSKHESYFEGSSVVSDLIDFLNASPTAFHAVAEAKKRLQSVGYEQVSERGDWKLGAGKKYFFTRNHSTIVAFAIGKKYVAGNGFHIVGAHTDSPCLKLKPVSKVVKGGYLEVGIQTYGGGLWHTWFDRDLTIAGRVIVREEKDGSVTYSHRLVRVKEPIMRIPTLAIHLDRNADGFKVNTQTQLLPVLATSIKAQLNKSVAETDQIKSEDQNNGKTSNEKATDNSSKHHSILLQLLADKLGCRPDDICDFELQACDTQPSTVAGAMKEFVFSGRLDNLCMSFCSLKALIDSTSSESSLGDEIGVRMIALFDHEEVGSNSAQGAGSPAMLNTLSRVTLCFTSDSKMLEKAIQRSFLVSADMAHALHPIEIASRIGSASSCSSSSPSSLLRQRSSPADFLSHFVGTDNNEGFTVTREMGSYSSQVGTDDPGLSRLKSQMSFSTRHHDSLSHISEESNVDHHAVKSNNSHHDAMLSYNAPTGFGMDSWDNNTNSIVFSPPPGKRAKNMEGDIYNCLNLLESQYSLPQTSLEMERLLQVPEDSIPCKIRAKRGCATHPRSIAERERRTRISGKLKKLQELVPNMDKQTSYSDMLDLAVQHIKGLQNHVKKIEKELEHCTCGCNPTT